MCGDSLQMTIQLLEATSETLTNQITDNSMTLRLTQKHSSNLIDEIHDRYGAEKDAIRNEIESLDKTEQSDEYQDLMTELKELREEEENEVARIEEDIKDKETNVQLENETLEVQLEEVNTQKESFQEMLKEKIEDNFGYFQ